MTHTQSIRPTYLDHEGFTYLEHNGEFFKGCRRCGGEGLYLHNGEHNRCYDCNDTSAKLGERFPSQEAAQKWCHGKALRRANAKRKREAEAAFRESKMQAKQDALKASDPDVYEFLMAVDEDNERSTFLLDMNHILVWPANCDRQFTPNMIAAVRRTLEGRVAQEAEALAHPAPVGRVVVTGEIATTKLVESQYGTAYKILVKDDAGYKVWASLPKAQADEAYDAFYDVHTDNPHVGPAVWFMGSSNEPDTFKGVKGSRITFTATLVPSDDDVSFAFGSRPTKGAWL